VGQFYFGTLGQFSIGVDSDLYHEIRKKKGWLDQERACKKIKRSGDVSDTDFQQPSHKL